MPKISQLPILTNINTGSIIPIVDNSTTQRISVGNLYEFLSGALDQTFSTEFELMQSASAITSSIEALSASLNTTITNITVGSASPGTVSSSNQITTLGFAKTGSNSFSGSQTILAGNSLLVNRIENTTGGNIEIAATGLLSLSGDGGGVTTNDNFEANPGGNATFKVISGSVIVTGSIRATGTTIISSSQQITNFGFATTSSVLNIDTSSLVTTSSFNTFTSSVNTFTASVNEKTGSYATTGSNTFIGNQTLTGSLNVSGSTSISGGLAITNNGYSWSFESNGRTKIPNITFNSDRGTGMVGIKAEVGKEFQIETSTTASSVGPWSFGLDGTLNAPSGANITRVANLITTSSFNTFTSSLNSFTASVIATGSNINSFTASVNGKTGSFATTGSNQFNGNQAITGSLNVKTITDNGSGLVIGNQIEATQAKTRITNGTTVDGTLTSQHIFEVGTDGVLSAYQVVNSLSEGGPSLTSERITELTTGSFKIGLRIINDLGEEGTTSSFNGWEFGTVGTGSAITFPDSTIQTTAFVPTTLVTTQSLNNFTASVATTSSINTLTSSFTTFSSSVNTTTASLNSFTASVIATGSLINTFTSSVNTTTASLNTTTASLNSKTGSYATTGSNIFTDSQNISGSLIVTGSARGNVVPITIVSSTASLDMTSGSYFTLTLANTTNTHIRVTSITPGVNATLLITTGTNSSASLSPLLLQPSGSSYTASLGSGKKDVLSLVAFDSTNMYVVSTKALQ